MVKWQCQAQLTSSCSQLTTVMDDCTVYIPLDSCGLMAAAALVSGRQPPSLSLQPRSLKWPVGDVRAA